jgi:hypothetical protein
LRGSEAELEAHGGSVGACPADHFIHIFIALPTTQDRNEVDPS